MRRESRCCMRRILDGSGDASEVYYMASGWLRGDGMMDLLRA